MADPESAVLTAIADLKASVGDLKASVGHLEASVGMRFDGMEARLTAVEEHLAPMRARLEGLPLITRAVTVIQQEQRLLKGAFNDFALTNVTAEEITAMHDDINRVQAENAELQARVVTLERLVRELQESR